VPFQTKRPVRAGAFLVLAMVMSWACTPGGAGDAMEKVDAEEVPQVVALGPVDGHDLPPTDLERVVVGALAPDFSLETLEGDTLTLSGFRGQQNVLLVFYRGHW
jgi:hypothetical protein